MAAWRKKIGDPLVVIHHGRVELTNGIGLAAYRGNITDKTHDAAIAALDDDFAQGRYRQGDVLWRAILKRAGELSRKQTRSIGCRSLDILHVASALQLEFKYFATFDVRQRCQPKDHRTLCVESVTAGYLPAPHFAESWDGESGPGLPGAATTRELSVPTPCIMAVESPL